MKSATLFIVLCACMFLVLSYHGEVKAASKRCSIVLFYPGKCGNDGNKVCLGDIRNDKKFGIVFKYDLCSCVDTNFPGRPISRSCNCSRPC
ncbi:hypothetical protein AALP_AA1G090500 [Arabis alpina]|uniref:Knottin scorpion toxin-like domain-containing protein n=1 Tax=Arabis alpina TaxID=50452 RepID=A0A087HM29_ARAAL|nr:hypothetical protein AALP_AA1G090500 [Arabis alpina]